MSDRIKQMYATNDERQAVKDGHAGNTCDTCWYYHENNAWFKFGGNGWCSKNGFSRRPETPAESIEVREGGASG